MSENVATSSSKDGMGQTKIIVIVAVLLAALGAVLFLNSPQYKAQQLLKEARQLIGENAFGQAARKLTVVVQGETKYVDRAIIELKGLNNWEYLLASEAIESLMVVETLVEVSLADESLYLNAIELANKHANKQLEISGRYLLAVNELPLQGSFPEEKSYEELLTAYDTAALPVFTNLNKSFPQNIEYAIQLALLQERAGAYEALLPLLEPFYSKLSTEAFQLSPGARILGQQLGYANRNEEAYEILNPYVSAKLEAYREAEATYDRVLQTVWDESIAALEQNEAPQSFYRKYEQADENTQNQMVSEFYAQRRDTSPLVAKALDDYRATTNIVRVALDLGTVMLYLAQEKAEESERNGLLEQAESTFLAIKGVAGESDEYRMYLGQVYYWLGKVDSGKALFEEFLAAKGRDVESLYWVSSILREVGEVTESRKLMLELYETATDKRDKYAAAAQLSILALSVEERISWAEKSDPSDIRTQADLADLKGRQAEQKNQFKVAEAHYKEAIGYYEQFDENSTTLNNRGLIYLSLHRVSDNKAYLDKGLEQLDKAVALAPSDSIILMNSAGVLQRVGFRGELSSVLFDSSRIPPSFSVISFLHNDEQGKQKIAQRLAENAAMKKAIQYLEKVTLLAPKNKDAYDQLSSIYGLFDDVDRLTTLNERVGKTELDLGDERAEWEAYISGEKDSSYKEAFINRDQFYSGVLKETGTEVTQETRAILSSYVLNARMNMESVGEEIDYQWILQQAKKNYQALACNSTREDYMRALLLTVIDRDLGQHAKLADINLEYSRLMSKHQILLASLDADPSLVQALTKNGNFQEFLTLAKEDGDLYQNNVDPLMWGILSHFDSAYAQQLQSRAQQLEEPRLHLEISKQLNYPSTASIYGQWLHYRMLGQQEKMAEVLSQANQLAIKLPIEYRG